MEDLSKATFFDKRIIVFLQKLLYSSGKVSTISSHEVKLLEQREELVNLNEALDRKLVQTLTDAQNYVPVPDALFFLLAAFKRNKLEDAQDVLHSAVYEEKTLDRAMLMEVLEKSDEMPMSWAMSLIGDNTEERYSAPPVPTTGLDLNRLRNFK